TISYKPAKAVKGQAVADFLAAHPVAESEEINDEFPDEQVMLTESQSPWQMYFDGAAGTSGAGAGVIFITPQGDLLLYSFTLGTTCTNNEAEYRALIIGMEIAHEMKIKTLHIFLVIPS
ncbi:reverse transcriptase-like protein, partial [Mycobacterium kansasii]